MSRLALALMVAVLSGCSGRVSEPSGLADPVGAVTFQIQNNTGAEVFVRWRDGEPLYDIDQSGKHLDPVTWCSSLCEQECACYDCSAPMPAVKRIAKGGTLTFTWSGTWYEALSCSAGCTCDQKRNAIPGAYEFTVAAARGYKASGSSSPSEQNGVISMADLDLAQGACEAAAQETLAPGAQTVELTLTCHGP